MPTTTKSSDSRELRRRSTVSPTGMVVLVFTLVLFYGPVSAAAERPGPPFFGFAGGCDTEAFLQETAPFTNICTVDLNDGRLLDARWTVKMLARGVRLIVSTHGTFFEPVGEPVDGRQLYDLRPDYRERWRAAIAGREDTLRALATHFFVADEPSWNGITRSELAAANEAIKTALPYATTVTSFSHRLDSGWFEGEEVPTDAVGYHQYRVFDPRADPLFRANVGIIKSHADARGFVYVLDAWWTPEHGDAGLDREDMAQVARNYRRMVADDRDAIGMIGFHWSAPAGAVGARDLPDTVVWTYRRLGSEVTGKCLAPPSVRPEHALFLLGCEYFATLRYRTVEGSRFAVAMPREHDFGTWVLEEGNVIAGLKIVAGDGFDVFPSLHADLAARIHVFDTETGRLIWPTRAIALTDR